MSKFIHADSLALYAQDAAECEEPWLRWQFECEDSWYDCTIPVAFSPDIKYRRKPKTILINGFEVPEPVREPLEEGQEYWLVELSTVEKTPVAWTMHTLDRQWLDAGLIHLTKEAAQTHIDALLSFTKRGE